MSDRLHDLFWQSVQRRNPLPPHLEARLQAIMAQVDAEGLPEDATDARYLELCMADPELQEAVGFRQFQTVVAEYALALGATYDAERDRWTPPAGMTLDELDAAVMARIRQRFGGEP